MNSDDAVRGYIRSSGAVKHTSSAADVPQSGKPYGAGIAWRSGEGVVFSGGSFSEETWAGDPNGITTIQIGARNSAAEPMNGHIRSITIGSLFDLRQAGHATLQGNERRFIGAGQSNAQNLFQNTTAGASDIDAGKTAFIDTIDPLLSGGTILFANGATGASALLKDSVGTDNHWYDDNTGTFGDALDKFEKAANTIGNTAELIEWDQGEADVGAILSGDITRARYKAAKIVVFQKLRSIVGDVPIIICPIGRRGSAHGAPAAIQDVREVQQELAAEYSWIHLGPEKFDLGLQDDVHLTDAGYATVGERVGRKAAAVLGESVTGVDGPSVMSASRSGTTVTVTLSHDAGTDFTPTSAISGFVFTDDGTPIAITATVRTNATTITLTLDSTPSGTELLYYGHEDMDDVTAANLVKDNASPSMPLKATKIAVT